jgi:hypothetical protein
VFPVGPNPPRPQGRWLAERYHLVLTRYFPAASNRYFENRFLAASQRAREHAEQ